MANRQIAVRAVALLGAWMLGMPGPAGAQPATPPCVIAPPAATPVPRPVMGTRDLVNQRYLQSRYGSFGSPWALRPKSDLPGASTRLGFHPAHASQTPGKDNTFAPLISQALWQDDLWDEGEQASDFARRLIFTTGAVTSSATNFASGENLSRSPNEREWDSKYNIGEIHVGNILRGGSADDVYAVFASSHYASTNYYDVNSFDPAGREPKHRRVHAAVVLGSESDGWIGRRITPNLGPSQNVGPYDGRDHAWREDDIWDPMPADVMALMGMAGGVFLDNKKGGYTSHWASNWFPKTNPPEGGFIVAAAAIRSFVGTGMRRTWVNAADVRGYLSQFIIMDDTWPLEPLQVSDKWLCDGNERPGSYIRSWTPMDIKEAFWGALDTIKVGAAPAFYFSAQIPGLVGSADFQVPQLFEPESTTISPERYAGIIRSDVVVGDGPTSVARTGYDTNVLHLRDVLHLSPRCTPPAVSDDLLPDDRVGLVYFDSVRNNLRLSIRQDDEFIWVDIPIDASNPDPVTSQTLVCPPEQLDELDEEDGPEATAAVLRPKVAFLVEPSRTAPLHLPARVTMMLSHFTSPTYRVFWRADPMKRYEAMPGWQQLNDQELRPVDGLPMEMAATMLIPRRIEVDGRGMVLQGRRIHVMIFDDETGRTFGGAFMLDADTPPHESNDPQTPMLAKPVGTGQPRE